LTVFSGGKKKKGWTFSKMAEFIEISPYELEGNVFEQIGKDWALITAMKKESGDVNTMTASWGGMGVIWRDPSFVCVIRPQRYTYEFSENADILTLSFFDEKYRDALKICGTKSGRDGNKIAEAGLTVVHDGEAAYFDEAKTVLVGRKVYTDMLREDSFVDKSIISTHYNGDLHRFYVCKIERVLIKK
jgi:flavin reductase (DIM6/NTAB) family NADH-FMN oxidoreductase RutF